MTAHYANFRFDVFENAQGRRLPLKGSHRVAVCEYAEYRSAFNNRKIGERDA